MDIHPHWNTTGQEEEKQPASIQIEAEDSDMPSDIPTFKRTVSRRPAAFTGIAIAIVLGLTYSNGWEMLRDISLPSFSSILAQITTSAPVISAPQQTTITDTGITPASIILAPGEAIVFENTSGIPHIIQFDSKIMGEANPPLASGAIFPGNSESVIIPVGTALGLYSFFSTTDPNSKGQILLQAKKPTTPGATSSLGISTDGVPLPGDNFDYTIPGTTTINAGTSSSSTPQTTQPATPQNPYTAGTNVPHPFDENGNPIASAYNEDGTLHSGAPLHETPKPQTAQTGSLTLPMLLVLVIVCVGFMCRKNDDVWYDGMEA